MTPRRSFRMDAQATIMNDPYPRHTEAYRGIQAGARRGGGIGQNKGRGKKPRVRVSCHIALGIPKGL